jgi:hypothetical protein
MQTALIGVQPIGMEPWIFDYVDGDTPDTEFTFEGYIVRPWNADG